MKFLTVQVPPTITQQPASQTVTTGKTVLWTMNGATKTASAYTSASAGAGWTVQ